ncbi:hypothetical protein FOZG_17713 [Fusarium oxysporum Fo47]|uniref:Uncharacterized protein n=1 Tax=Fusarium oxysporum Fo47 TaxID=660027 RepID=W9JGL8_FUSOX|nr:hypothetical protein FOZG_17713 [Fusarium oxysporum Fo47]
MVPLFFGQPAENAVYLLRASRAVSGVSAIGAEAVSALLGGDTVPGVVAGGLAAAFTQGESIAGRTQVRSSLRGYQVGAAQAVGKPLLPSLYGGGPQVGCPFGLSLHEEITGGYIGGKHGPSGPNLEYAQDLSWIHSKFPGYMGPDYVVVVGPSRSFGVQSDKDTEVHSE